MSFLTPKKPIDTVVPITIRVDRNTSSVQIGPAPPIIIGDIGAPDKSRVDEAIQSYNAQLTEINNNPTVLSLNEVKTAFTTLRPLCVAYSGDKTKLTAIVAANKSLNTAITNATGLTDAKEFTDLTTDLTAAIDAANSAPIQRIGKSQTTATINGFGVKIDELVKNIDAQIVAAQTAAAAALAEGELGLGFGADRRRGGEREDEESSRRESEAPLPVDDAAAKELAEKKAAAAAARIAADAAKAAAATARESADDAKATAEGLDATDVNKNKAMTMANTLDKSATEANAEATRLDEEAVRLDSEVAALEAGTKSGGSRPKNTRKRRQKRSKRKTAYRRRY